MQNQGKGFGLEGDRGGIEVERWVQVEKVDGGGG